MSDTAELRRAAGRHWRSGHWGPVPFACSWPARPPRGGELLPRTGGRRDRPQLCRQAEQRL